MERILLTFSIAFILVMGLAGAALEDLGTFKYGEDINIIQLCANCTYNNITSITGPNSQVLVEDIQMTKDGSYYNYTLSKDHTDTIGVYNVNGIGDPDGEAQVWAYKFIANAQGIEYTAAHGIIYLIMFLLFVAFFIFCLYFAFTLPWQTLRQTEDGQMYKINWKKYLKLLSYVGAWLSFVFISFYAWNLSHGILQFEPMANAFHFVFELTLRLSWLVIPIFLVIGTIKYVQDQKWQKMLNKGLTIDHPI